VNGTLAVFAEEADEADLIRELYAKHLGNRLVAISRMFGGKVELRSHGATVETTDGSSFINCAGYGVFLLGATNPHVIAAVGEQLRTHPISSRLFIDGTSARAAAALSAIAPPGIDKVYFANSGAEAVETALKLARINGCRRIVTTTNSYHGRTIGALSVSARPIYQDPFKPLLSDVAEVPFNNPSALDEMLADRPLSCFIVEPIQGEGGVNIPSGSYLAEVSKICKDRDCFLIIDEILTGLGRLGKMWAISDMDVHPDVLLAGKTLSGGAVPVSAVLATSEAYAPFERDPMLHQSTFSGAPIATAAALATIEALAIYDVIPKAKQYGLRLLDSFRELSKRAPEGVVKEVRGAGLLLGIEFTDGGYAGEMMLGLIENGILANHSVNSPTVIRFTPPAILTEEELCAIEYAVGQSFVLIGQY
jgi:putrescine aminotransferase